MTPLLPDVRLADLSSVVADGLGLRWDTASDPSPWAGLALRDNPKRAHLVVSRVLGKHLPVPGAVAEQAGHDLGRQVRALLGDGPPPVVLGYCETATSLGQLVAEALPGSDYVHTTRRPDPAVPALGGFEEEHSHATSHVLQPRDPSWLTDPRRPLVLVDDELTSGRTVANTLAALPPHDRVVVATLLDLRPAALRDPGLEVVAGLSGELVVPADVQDRASALRAALADVPAAPVPDGRGDVVVHSAVLPGSGRTGLGEQDRAVQADLLQALAARLPVPDLVLGSEELMRPAVALAALHPGAVVHSTTRSPVLAVDVEGYAVRRAVTFPAPDEPGRTSRLHGLPDAPLGTVVVLVDGPRWQGLAETLRPWGDVHVVRL